MAAANDTDTRRSSLNVHPFPPQPVELELTGGRLHIRDLDLDGTIVELAEELGFAGQPDDLARLLRQVVETGAIVVSHGQRRAAVDALAGEVDRLLQQTAAATGKLPTEVQEQLRLHLTQLASLLDARFDASRTSSVQHQLANIVKTTTNDQARALLSELVGEHGPLAAANNEVARQLQLIVGTNSDMLAKVTSLIEKLERNTALDKQHQRSTQKGARFEDEVELELTAIHGRLGDDVRSVKHETGLVAGSAAGDFIVTVDTSQSGGRDARIAVEAKTGKLSAPQARTALKQAIANRGAHAGILVFDGVEDAPLRGRHYLASPDGRFITILDQEQGTLGFEVACIQARLYALAAVAAEGEIDAKWVVTECDKLTQLIEEASKIKRGTAAARKGLDTVDQAYDNLRRQALAILDTIKQKLA